MGKEIELKFLMVIGTNSIIPVTTDIADIQQYYLSISKEREERMRKVYYPLTGISQFYRTVKEGHGLVRSEVEHEIDSSLYETNLPNHVGHVLCKTRRKFPLGSLMTLEYDTYMPLVAGVPALYIGEIELRFEAHKERALAEMAAFCEQTHWGFIDVTEDARYKAKNLALNGYPQ